MNVPLDLIEAVPRLVPETSIENVHLTAVEGFVWSRVDGILNVGELSTITGLPEDQICQILQKLATHRLVELSLNPGLSIAELGAASIKSPEADDERAFEEAVLAAEKKKAPESGLEEAETDLAAEIRQEIDLFYERLDEYTFYEALGIDPASDQRAVLRAYKQRSLKFHPDRYFGKKLGAYKSKLEEIFKYLSRVKDFLTDPASRHTYDASLSKDMELLQELEAAQRIENEAYKESASSTVQGEGAGDVFIPAPSESRAASPIASVAEENGSRRPRQRRRSPLTARALAVRLGISQNEPVSPQAPLREEISEKRRQQARLRISQAAMKAVDDQRKQRADVHYQDGIQQLLANNFIGAASSLKLALVFDPDNDEYKKKYHVASTRAGEILAERDLKQARFHASVGRWEAAARAFAKAADHHPNLQNMCEAAQALVKAGQLREAKHYAIKGTEIEPENVKARVTLAVVFHAAGMHRNARRELDHALGLDPDNKEARSLLREVRKVL